MIHHRYHFLHSRAHLHIHIGICFLTYIYNKPLIIPLSVQPHERQTTKNMAVTIRSSSRDWILFLLHSVLCEIAMFKVDTCVRQWIWEPLECVNVLVGTVFLARLQTKFIFVHSADVEWANATVFFLPFFSFFVSSFFSLFHLLPFQIFAMRAISSSPKTLSQGTLLLLLYKNSIRTETKKQKKTGIMEGQKEI